MELPVSAQAWQFFQSVLLGLGLSLCYDLLRGLRRLRPGLTWLLDLLFGLILTASLLLFAIYPGQGLFRIYAGLGLLLGTVLWFLTVSRWFLLAWTVILHGIGRLIGLLLGPFLWILKKIGLFAKNAFQLGKNGLQ